MKPQSINAPGNFACLSSMTSLQLASLTTIQGFDAKFTGRSGLVIFPLTHNPTRATLSLNSIDFKFQQEYFPCVHCYQQIIRWPRFIINHQQLIWRFKEILCGHSLRKLTVKNIPLKEAGLSVLMFNYHPSFISYLR
jgi:uncharacterized CHY-type Zn-finger protein